MYAIRSYYELLTNSPAETDSPLPRPAAETAGYTQDEQQNISVYKNAKDAVVNITTETVVITSYSIHYTKLYDQGRHTSRGRGIHGAHSLQRKDR